MSRLEEQRKREEEEKKRRRYSIEERERKKVREQLLEQRRKEPSVEEMGEGMGEDGVPGISPAPSRETFSLSGGSPVPTRGFVPVGEREEEGARSPMPSHGGRPSAPRDEGFAIGQESEPRRGSRENLRERLKRGRPSQGIAIPSQGIAIPTRSSPSRSETSRVPKKRRGDEIKR